ncbi:MAG: redoxin domain-containing protein, partial [Ignavibacteria bacterium]|nr:redoxin domain-containing protein [Ignavibacteria bacterium]
MKTIKIISYLLLILSLNGFSFANPNTNPKSVIGNAVTDFTLKNTDSQDISLSDYPDAKGFVIVFTCNHCPFAKLYPQRLNELNTKYQALDIPLLAVNSMDTLMYEEEGFEIMQTKSASESFNFPYLQDGSQIVGKDFGAAL